MDLREHTGKFLTDLAKMIFGGVVVAQAMSDKFNLSILVLGFCGSLGLFILSLFFLKGKKK